MLTDQEMFDRMKDGWRTGRPETICGPGSMNVYTENFRRWLPRKVEELGVRSICDAGAGDLHLYAKVRWRSEVDFKGFDLIPRHPSIQQLDICKDALPPCDLIVCRLVMGHINDEDRRRRIVELFRSSGKYLMATTFVDFVPSDRESVKLDMRVYLGEPMEMIGDGNHDKCRMGLWSL